MFAIAIHTLHLLPFILFRKNWGLGRSVDVLSPCDRKDNVCFLCLFLDKVDIQEHLLPNVQKPVKTVQYDEFVLLFLTWPLGQ